MYIKLFILSLFLLFSLSAFPQNGVQIGGVQLDGDRVEGGRVEKSIESNYNSNTGISSRVQNFSFKGDIEKLFFGDFNAAVEFFLMPSFEGSSALRIYKDSLTNSCLLEVKYISNYKEVQKELSERYPLWPGYSDQIRKHNNEMFEARDRETPKLLKINIFFIPVSNRFAGSFYDSASSFIKNYEVKKDPQVAINGEIVVRLISDGEVVIFRSVVEDEVWTLKIHEPRGNAAKMAEICKQIISDVKDGGGNKFDESKYIALLNF